MKPNPWLYPAIALIGVASWIGLQKKSISDLQQEITLLREGIRKVQENEAAEEKSRTENANAEEKKIDWKRIGQKYVERQNGEMPDMLQYMRLQRLILKMTPEELIDQLDELDTLSLPDQAKQYLLSMVVGQLGETHPEYLLQRYQDLIGDPYSPLRWQFQRLLDSWAKNDLQSAVTWLDQQIVSGRLDSKALSGRNEAWFQLEAAILRNATATNLQLAIDRMMKLPPEERHAIIQQHLAYQTRGSSATSGNLSKLARATLPPKQATEAIANFANTLFSQANSLERIDQFIANSEASAEEKAAITESIIISNISPWMHSNAQLILDPEHLNSIRDWAAKHSPDTVDTATGTALSQAMRRGLDFEQAAKIATDYQQKTNSDAVLIALLESENVRHGKKYASKAKELISQISDPVERERIEKLPGYQKK